MGLFSKKEKKEEEKRLVPLQFPDFAKKEQPGYEKSIGITPEARMIKEEVAKTEPQPMPREVAKPEEFSPSVMEKKLDYPHFPEEGMGESHHPAFDKPLFVKIDDYKDAMTTLKELKTKLKESTDILTELSKIKEREEEELEGWHNQLEEIKTKLEAVDKTLFGL